MRLIHHLGILMSCLFFHSKMGTTGLSMNFFHAGNKSPVQRGFFTNIAGDLLPTLGFLGGLYNFFNFTTIFSLM